MFNLDVFLFLRCLAVILFLVLVLVFFNLFILILALNDSVNWPSLSIEEYKICKIIIY